MRRRLMCRLTGAGGPADRPFRGWSSLWSPCPTARGGCLAVHVAPDGWPDRRETEAVDDRGDTPKGVRVEPVPEVGALSLEVDKPGFAEDAKVMRHRWLGDAVENAEPAAADLPVARELAQHVEADGVRERGKQAEVSVGVDEPGSHGDRHLTRSR